MPSSTNTMPAVGAQRTGLAHKTKIRLFQLAVVVLMFGSWEGLGRAGVVDRGIRVGSVGQTHFAGEVGMAEAERADIGGGLAHAQTVGHAQGSFDE